jgi:hypothetical protein
MDAAVGVSYKRHAVTVCAVGEITWSYCDFGQHNFVTYSPKDFSYHMYCQESILAIHSLSQTHNNVINITYCNLPVN